jgi:protein-S-isoprenylcysteine O-methyltransferase Ste14
MSQADPLSVQRGDYGRSISSNLLMSVGRALTGPAQYLLIALHPLAYFGVPPPPLGSPSISLFGRTFPRLPFLTALMPGVLSIKHVVWVNFMMRERMTLKFATFAILSDFVYESVSSTVFATASINPLWNERYFYVGFTIFMASMAVEFLAELQRIAFKAKKENRGKVCKSGFWAITRHINYTANTLFGFGYGLATGGPIYSLATAGMYIANFTLNAMPSIETYCREKYGDDWKQYEREVPWQLFPGIY